jgi:hypothetical protein
VACTEFLGEGVRSREVPTSRKQWRLLYLTFRDQRKSHFVTGARARNFQSLHALRGEIIKRDERVMERERGAEILTASKRRAILLRQNSDPKYFNFQLKQRKSLEANFDFPFLFV